MELSSIISIMSLFTIRDIHKYFSAKHEMKTNFVLMNISEEPYRERCTFVYSQIHPDKLTRPTVIMNANAPSRIPLLN